VLLFSSLLFSSLLFGRWVPPEVSRRWLGQFRHAKVKGLFCGAYQSSQIEHLKVSAHIHKTRKSSRKRADEEDEEEDRDGGLSGGIPLNHAVLDQYGDIVPMKPSEIIAEGRRSGELAEKEEKENMIPGDPAGHAAADEKGDETASCSTESDENSDVDEVLLLIYFGDC
jgi:hypothetical protein